MVLKKQSSFLIENRQRKSNRSFLDLSADDMGDNKSDLSNDDIMGSRSMRILRHQNSSQALLKRGGFKLSGAFRGLGCGFAGSKEELKEEIPEVTRKTVPVTKGEALHEDD